MTLVPKNQHLDALVTLAGRSRGASILKNLQTRDSANFWIFRENTSVGLVAISAGSAATYLVTSPHNMEEVETLATLLGKSLSHLEGKSIALAQTVFDPNATLQIEAFRKAGFTHLAILNYLERKEYAKIPDVPIVECSWESMETNSDGDLGPLLETTYLDSLDCPKIHGMRSIQDVIEGHRSAERYDPALWSICIHDGKQVGVILLNNTQVKSCMELAYLGVIPSTRGQGFGDVLLHRMALQMKALMCDRITLAVDSKNLPALSLYERWEFKMKSQRMTMIRKLF